MSIHIDPGSETVIIDGMKFDISVLKTDEFRQWKRDYETLYRDYVQKENEYRLIETKMRSYYDGFCETCPGLVSERVVGDYRIYGYSGSGTLENEEYCDGMVQKNYSRSEKTRYKFYVDSCAKVEAAVETLVERRKAFEEFLEKSPDSFRLARKVEQIMMKYCGNSSF